MRMLFYRIKTIKMKDYNKNCLMLNDSIDKLVNEFALKYYGEDCYIVRIDRDIDCLHYNLQINDDYRNIDEIYTALRYNIPKEILFKYYEERLDKATKHETMPNLENYFNLFKNVPWTDQN